MNLVAELDLDACRNMVRQLCQKYGWTLLGEAEFTQQLVARASTALVNEERELRQLALNIYALAAHDACIGVDEGRRKRSAEDLFRYLYAVLKPKYNREEIVIEMVQDALLRILSQCRRCREAGAFLYFCLQRLRHAEDAYHREEERRRQTTTLLSSTGDEAAVPGHSQTTDVMAATTGPPQMVVECLEVMERLLNTFQQIYQEKRRAQRQLEVIYYSFFKVLTDQEIAQILQVTEAQVQVLRSRGLAQLRPYQTFLQLLREWVTNCKHSGIVVLYQ